MTIFNASRKERQMDKVPGQPRTKKSEIAADMLRDHMIRHQLRPGDRLPTEDQLSELFGVSRVSVREATKALQFLGIVEAAPRRGLTVGRVSMKRVSEYLGFYFASTNLPIEELIATRVIIETGGLERISQRMSKDWTIYEKLQRLNDQLSQTKRMRDWIATDVRFHCQLVSSSGLRTLCAFNDLLQVFFERLRKDFPKTGWEQGISEHQQIIDALRDEHVELATTLLRSHIETHLERLSSARAYGGTRRSSAANNGSKRADRPEPAVRFKLHVKNRLGDSAGLAL